MLFCPKISSKKKKKVFHLTVNGSTRNDKTFQLVQEINLILEKGAGETEINPQLVAYASILAECYLTHRIMNDKIYDDFRKEPK